MTSVLLVASRINRAAHVANAAPSDAVVVLGCAVQPDGTPSPALRARIEEGVRVWRDTGSRYLLVTGGVGTYPPAEAVVMRQIAEAQGVPPSALIDDTTAHTTEGSAWMCSRIATRLGWKRVTLISDPWHLLRARHQFADYHPGLDVRQSPAVLSPHMDKPQCPPALHAARVCCGAGVLRRTRFPGLRLTVCRC